MTQTQVEDEVPLAEIVLVQVPACLLETPKKPNAIILVVVLQWLEVTDMNSSGVPYYNYTHN